MHATVGGHRRLRSVIQVAHAIIPAGGHRVTVVAGMRVDRGRGGTVCHGEAGSGGRLGGGSKTSKKVRAAGARRGNAGVVLGDGLEVERERLDVLAASP